MIKRRCIWVVFGVVLMSLSAESLRSQSIAEAKSDEYLLLGNPNRGAGEPWVFVNPKDPKNIIVDAMSTLNRLPTGEVPTPRTRTAGPSGPMTPNPDRTALRIKELSTPDGSLTAIAITHDGGNTWTFSEDNLRKILAKNRCSDTFAGAGPDGALYMGCLAYLNRGDADYKYGWAPNGEAWYYHGGSAIERSMDEGRTWSQPVWVQPALSPSLYAPTVHPVFEQASPWDRPDFVVDASTNTIYISGSGLAYTVEPKTVHRPVRNPNIPGGGYTGYPPPDVSRRRTFLRASHDDGRSWGVIYPMDSDEYPGAGGFSAAFGHLVVAYPASRVPASENATCPCTVFGVSQNYGQTFDYKVLPPIPSELTAAEAPTRGGFPARIAVMVSADPSRERRCAVARIVGKKILVSLTEDGGKTWLAPVVAGELPSNAMSFSHHAMKYSPKGDLGIIWKAVYPDGSFDMWSAVSRDGGSSFKTIRVSHAVSPTYINDRGNFMFGDDLSTLDIDREYLYAVWGDNRSGFEGTWFGRVSLSAY